MIGWDWRSRRSSRFAAASTPSRPRTSRNECPVGRERRNRAHGPHGQCHVDRLEASSQFEQEFVSNASHELRSPLTTLLATTERAAKDPDHADWNEVGESSCARAADSKR